MIKFWNRITGKKSPVSNNVVFRITPVATFLSINSQNINASEQIDIKKTHKLSSKTTCISNTTSRKDPYKKKSFEVLTFALKMLMSYGALPYKWNYGREYGSSSPSISPQTSGFKMSLFYLNLISVNCFTIWLWVGLLFIAYNFDEKKIGSQLIPHAANASVFSIACLINSSVFLKCNELITFLNQYFIFEQNHIQTRTKKEAQILELVQRILMVIFTSIPLLNGFLYFSQSGGIRYMTSIFGIPKSNWGIRIILAIWEVLWMLNCLYMYFTAYVFVAFITNVPYWIRSLRKDVDGYNEKGDKHTMELLLNKIVLEYHSMQLLCRVFNEFFAPIIVPGHKVVGIILSVCAIYGCIRMVDIIPMPGFMFMPALLTMYVVFTMASFPKASAVRLVANNLVRYGRHCTTNYQLRVFFRSAIPLTIEVGPYYVYQKSTFLTFWGIIINYANSLLVSM